MEKKKVTASYVNLDALSRDTRFPLRFPIEYDDLNCGTLLIDFEPEPFSTLAEGELGLHELTRDRVQSEIIASSVFWQHDIKLSMKLRDRYRASKEDLLNLLLSYDYENAALKRYRGRHMFILGEDLVLEFIESEGPAALRLLPVFVILINWLCDSKRAGTRLEKLSNALIQHQTGKRKGEIRFPDGRPPTEAVEFFGATTIKEFYEDLTSFLKLARKKKGQEHYDNKKEDMGRLMKLIEESTSDYIKFLESKCRLRPGDQKAVNRLRRLQETYKEDQKKSYSLVFDCLNNDPELLAEFNIRSSKPNYMAKQIVGKLIGVSSDTITNILYRNSAKKQTEPS